MKSEFSTDLNNPKILNPILNPRIQEFKILNPRIKDLGFRKSSIADAQRIAVWLSDTLNSPDYLPFFLKAAWRIDELTLQRYLVSAKELGNNPRAYFISLVKKDSRYAQ